MPSEAMIRLAVFLGLLLLFAVLESLVPRRKRVMGRLGALSESWGGRWGTNLAMVVLDTLALRVLALALPALAVGAAIDAWRQGWGLFNALDWPFWWEAGLALLLLDFAIWLQHLVTHKVPLFWRFHRVHHADRDLDVTTALRFHPVEILASMGLKIGLIYLIGPQALVVLVFEILLNGTALFTHANLRLPSWLDRGLRLLIVTPGMHLVHHSARREEHDSNYGFALSVWDRIFGTYVAGPAAGQDAMTVGLQWQDEKPAKLGWSLMLPFRR